MKGLKEIFETEIKNLKSQNLLRSLRNYENYDLISFSSNDYLGLSHNKNLIEAGISAAQKYGAGAGASRLITGNNILYDDLEKNISKLHNSSEAVVFSSGYAANIGAIPAFVGKGDLIIADKLSHSCIIDGAKLSNAEFKRFNHNNYAHLEKILQDRKKYKNCLIITESVFSMDGDRADLRKINEIAKKYDSFVMVDFAHDIEFDEWNFKSDNFIKMGTLSKAFAGLGGYICGSKNINSFLVNKAKSLIFSTALPPSVLASNNEAIKLVNKDKKIGNKALENAKYFYEAVKNKIGDFIINKPESQIVPVIVGDNKKAMEMAKKLEEAKLLVSAIRPPTVPKNTARLRFSFSNSHSDKDIENLAKAFISAIK